MDENVMDYGDRRCTAYLGKAGIRVGQEKVLRRKHKLDVIRQPIYH